MTTVAENKAAIGYISLGSLNDTVKAVKIDGAEASVDTVKDGSYKIVRPFNIVTKDKLSKQAQDFENYIMSADGQKIIQDNGYIKADEKAPAYKSNGAKGKVVVGGSSSVTPVMEKLKEDLLLFAEKMFKNNENHSIDKDIKIYLSEFIKEEKIKLEKIKSDYINKKIDETKYLFTIKFFKLLEE
jgi:ABC-type phosphate transport system substrate-binding protein